MSCTQPCHPCLFAPFHKPVCGVLPSSQQSQSIQLSNEFEEPHDHTRRLPGLLDTADLVAELGDALHPALPSLSALHHLTNLSVSWCRPASSLKVLSSLTSLKSLMISKWPFATNADCLGQLTQLTSLRLCDMYNLALKDHLSSLAALQELTVLECGSKTMTSFLWASRITGLQSLQVFAHTVDSFVLQ
jgi:hypothetical protein